MSARYDMEAAELYVGRLREYVELMQVSLGDTGVRCLSDARLRSTGWVA